MTPTTSLFSISKLTPLSAQKLNGVGMRIRATQLARDPALDLIDQYLAIDDAKAVFFREVFYSDDGWHRKSRKLEG
jgi:hypothetical protein